MVNQTPRRAYQNVDFARTALYTVFIGMNDGSAMIALRKDNHSLLRGFVSDQLSLFMCKGVLSCGRADLSGAEDEDDDALFGSKESGVPLNRGPY